jgi:hypothetical protein
MKARKNFRTTVFTGVGAIAVAGTGLAFAMNGAHAATGPAPQLSQNNAVFTSNGEAGYYTKSTTAFIEVHGVITPQVPAEEMGVNGGLGLQLGDAVPSLNNVVNFSTGQQEANPSVLNPTVPATIESACTVTQIGLKWNSSTNQYDVYEAQGVLSYDPGTGTNPLTGPTVFSGGTEINACTAGGSLSPETGTTYYGGFSQVTTEVQEILGQAVGTPGITPGQTVYLALQRGTGTDGVPHGVVKGIAQNLSNPVDESTAHLTALGSSFLPHFANAGTVYDNTLRGPGTLIYPEAVFDGLRAATSVTHHAIDEQVFSNWTQEGVESSANGTGVTNGDPAAVLVSTLPYSMFSLYVGPPIGA